MGTRDGRYETKWISAPKWGKSGTFKDQFSVHFASASQNILKTILESLRLALFEVYLTNFGTKPAISNEKT